MQRGCSIQIETCTGSDSNFTDKPSASSRLITLNKSSQTFNILLLRAQGEKHKRPTGDFFFFNFIGALTKRNVATYTLGVFR